MAEGGEGLSELRRGDRAVIEWLSRLWRSVKRRLRLVDCFRDEWRKVSTWITAFALAIYGAFLAFPELAMEAWRALPDDLKTSVPFQDKIAAILFAAIFFVKFVKQKPRGEG